MLVDLIGPGDTEVQWRIKGITVVTIGAQMLAFNPEGEVETPEGRINSPRAGFALLPWGSSTGRSRRRRSVMLRRLLAECGQTHLRESADG